MEKKITALNLTEELAEKRGISVSSADAFVRTFFDVIIDGLEKDGIVKIKGWGTFKLAAIKDRESVDVTTGERIVIKGYRKVTFLPETSLKDYINRPFSQFETTELSDDFQLDDEPVEVVASPVEVEEPFVEAKEPIEVKELTAEATEPVEAKEPLVEATEPIEAKEPTAEENGVQPDAFLGSDAVAQVTDELSKASESAEVEETEIAEKTENPDTSETPEIAETERKEIPETPETPEIEEDSIIEKEPEITENPEPQEATSVAEPPVKTDMPKQTVATEKKPRRSWKYWLPILLLVLISLCLLIYIFFGKGFSRPTFYINSADKDKIKVEAITFDDESKKSKNINVTFPERKPNAQETPTEGTLEEPDEEATEDVKDASEVEPVVEPEEEPNVEPETQAKPKEEEKAEPKVEEKSEPLEEPKKEAVQPKPKVVAPAGNPLEKNLKDITLADTLGHTIEGTLATHTLQVDETIVRLAQKYYGDKRLWPYIVKYNEMKNPNSIVVGNTLKIPKLKAKE